MVGFYNYTVILTYMGLCSSVCGMALAMNGNLKGALLALLISGLCDGLDGTVAKTMKRTEEEKRFGIQIDSLCDVICFGVFPAFFLYALGVHSPLGMSVMAFYVLCGVIRLAYFNVTEETRQKTTEGVRKEYLGVPISTAALTTPFAFVFRPLFGEAFPIAYAVWLLIVGFCFIAPLHVPKPHGKGLIPVIGFGALLFFWFVFGFRG